MPALLMRMSRESTISAAAWICALLVTSRISGVTRASGCARAWRVPAYTRRAPLFRASLTSACPMPRLAPVTRTVLPAIAISAPCRYGPSAYPRSPRPDRAGPAAQCWPPCGNRASAWSTSRVWLPQRAGVHFAPDLGLAVVLSAEGPYTHCRRQRPARLWARNSRGQCPGWHWRVHAAGPALVRRAAGWAGLVTRSARWHRRPGGMPGQRKRREPALAGTHGATATAPATARLANANFTGDLMDLRSAQRHAGHGATGLVADR